MEEDKSSFRSSEYWRFSGLKPDRGYPKKIRSGFSGIPDGLDAAFVWSGNDKIYFFKGSKYWKFDPEARPPVEADYPKPVNNWIGVPDNIDGALQYDNGYTYFFKGGQYYRFDDMKFEVLKMKCTGLGSSKLHKLFFRSMRATPRFPDLQGSGGLAAKIDK